MIIDIESLYFVHSEIGELTRNLRLFSPRNGMHLALPHAFHVSRVLIGKLINGFNNLLNYKQLTLNRLRCSEVGVTEEGTMLHPSLARFTHLTLSDSMLNDVSNP